MMRVLIIGGTSSVAQALKPRLSLYAEAVFAGRSGCEIFLDLSNDHAQIKIPEGFDCIVNTAAAFGGKSPEEKYATEKVNALGALALYNASLAAGAKHFIHLSSIYSLLTPNSSFYSIYALSKKHGEDLLTYQSRDTNLPLTILRPAQLFGDTEAFRKHQPFIYAIADKAQKGEDIVINGHLDPKRNFLHVDDLAEIIVQVILQKITGTYNCMFPSDYTFSRIAQAAIDAFDSPSKIVFNPELPNIPDNIFTPDHSISEKTGFTPCISIEEGMKRISQNRNKPL